MDNQPRTEARNTSQAPYPALVYLSGRQRGTTQLLLGDRLSVLATADRQVSVVAGTTGAADATSLLATLERRGASFELLAQPGVEIWVNGEQVDGLVLASGDVIEIGKSGAVVRFRLYPPDRGPYKTLAEAFSDCLDCARYGSNGPLDRARVLLAGLPYELTTQTTPLIRATMAMVVLLLVISTATLFIRSFNLERRLVSETARVEELVQLLDAGEQRSFGLEDFEAARAEVEGLIGGSLARLEALEARAGATERVISTAAESVVFLQGAYGFVDPQSGKPLRLALGPGGEPLRVPGGGAMITVSGDGPEVEILYTGSGFVVSNEGHVLTNLHVAAPWRFDDEAQRILARGFRPVMRRFVGYLPGVEEPFEVELVEPSDRADVALLRYQLPTTRVRPLSLVDSSPRAGEEVIVLGYPAGIRALMARAEASFVQELIDGGAVSFWDVAEGLSAAGYIAPLATQGIVGQITSGAVVYDAETTHGGRFAGQGRRNQCRHGAGVRRLQHRSSGLGRPAPARVGTKRQRRQLGRVSQRVAAARAQ